MLLWPLGPPPHATAVTARRFFQLFIKRPQEWDDFCTVAPYAYKTAAGRKRLKQNGVSAALARLAYEILALCPFGILKFWNPEIMESQNSGILESWNPGILKFWNTDILESWNILFGVSRCDHLLKLSLLKAHLLKIHLLKEHFGNITLLKVHLP